MSTAFLANDTNSRAAEYQLGTPENYPESYRCHLAIMREDDDSISVVVLNLPGTGSCGETEDEAVANTREAIAAVIQTYKSSSQDIPWSTSYSVPDGAKQKWILVDV